MREKSRMTQYLMVKVTLKSLTKPQHQQEMNIITFNVMTKINAPKISGHQPKHNTINAGYGKFTSLKITNITSAFAFTNDMVHQVIKESNNSKPIGPNGIATVMMKILGPSGNNYLKRMYNLSVHHKT